MMIAQEVRTIEMPATGQTGAETPCADLVDCAVMLDFAGAGASSVKVQGKLAGTWIDLTAAVNATTALTLSRTGTTELGTFSVPYSHVRIVSTTTGAPAPTAKLVGRR